MHHTIQLPLALYLLRKGDTFIFMAQENNVPFIAGDNGPDQPNYWQNQCDRKVRFSPIEKVEQLDFECPFMSRSRPKGLDFVRSVQAD
ncbi:MAG: hypothetical protein C9356_02735 [Oleiphilus sp.]|nr:MAG: hypothetical protein C9356_02735 [Oleiphilus sp.]